MTMLKTSTPAAFGMGVLCGAALGAIAGLLFAPRPGSVLRRGVADSVSDMTRQASATMADVAARSRRAWVAGREAFNAEPQLRQPKPAIRDEALVR